MNLTISPVNTQIIKSQNINSKGLVFRADKQITTKDVFVPSFRAATVSGIAENQGNNKKTIQRVYSNLMFMCNTASLVDRNFGYPMECIDKDLEKLPQDSTKDFINEVMNCIANAEAHELCSVSGGKMGSEGNFLLKTSQNLLLLKVKSNMTDTKKFKDFEKQVQQDVITSKNLMSLINSNDWEATRKINLDSNAVKLGIDSLY